MTTPLPPLPRITEDPFRHYTAAQLQAYATKACADLEAEVAKLREALTQTADALSLAQTDVHWELHSPTRKVLRKAELAARAALESKP